MTEQSNKVAYRLKA